jgi:alpha-L-fucosidase
VLGGGLAAAAVAGAAVTGLAPPVAAAPAAPAVPAGVRRPSGRSQYGPTSGSLAGHPLPAWWHDARFGVFIHWGAYAVPSYSPPHWIAEGSAWYWAFQQIAGTPQYQHHRETYGTRFLYDDFLPQFKAERYDPAAWVDLIERAGARYFVMTTKHHDGFCLFPSAVTGRHTSAIGPGRDLIGPMVATARDRGLKVGLYYSVPEWYNPAPVDQLTLDKVTNVAGELQSAQDDVLNNELLSAISLVGFNLSTPKNAYTAATVPYRGYRPVADYAQFQRTQLRELIERYHPDELWADIGGPEQYFQNNGVIADFYNQALDHNPDGVVVNDRFGDHTTHRDYAVFENGGSYTAGSYTGRPTETVRTMGSSWGYNRWEIDYGDPGEYVQELADAVAHNSNYVLNIGPRADGTIPQPMVTRLTTVGDWLAINGEAIYGSRPWVQAADGNVRFTRQGEVVYLLAIGWPGAELTVKAPVPVRPTTNVTLLGSDGRPLRYRQGQGTFTITTPAGGTAATRSRHVFVFRVSPA